MPVARPARTVVKHVAMPVDRPVPMPVPYAVLVPFVKQVSLMLDIFVAPVPVDRPSIVTSRGANPVAVENYVAVPVEKPVPVSHAMPVLMVIKVSLKQFFPSNKCNLRYYLITTSLLLFS